MLSRSLSWLAAVVCLVLPLAASANDIAVELIGKALEGQSRPALVLHANRAVASAKASLRYENGKAIELRSGPIPPGSKKELFFDAPVGTTRFTGALEVLFTDGGEGEMPLSFDVTVSPGLKIVVDESALDLKRGSLGFRLEGGRAAKCEHDVVFDGKSPRHGWTRFSGEPAGTPLTIAWNPHGPDDVVLRIQLTCHDTEGFFSPTVELFPWRLEIPHEDVVFATGKSEIDPGEAPKLDAALKEIQTALRRYGQAISLDKMQIKLYVGGHTDTVGDAASNRALSLSRARSIAGYFRKKGLSIPIYYVGFGEERPAVQTPDDTDEIRNRRAEYVIGVEPPLKAGWQRLK